MISDFGVDFEAWLLVLLGFGAKTTEVSHLRSKIKKTSIRKSRNAFRKWSRKSSSQRRTRENWGFRLPERFLDKKPWPHDLGFSDRFRSLAAPRFWSIFRLFWRHFFRGVRIRKSILQKCISFDPSQNLFFTSFLSCKTA